MIVTFYSYKGGVGRSMALANVGQWLYQQGLRVLLIDWDLEAPGLENYFASTPAQAEEIRQRPGVIDLLRAYERQFPNLGIHPEASRENVLEVLRAQLPSVSHYVAPLNADHGPEGAGLWLLPAGMRLDKHFSGYAEAVQGFDWEDLYARYHGEELFEWLRESVHGHYDFVLVDSRTGVTEMGGVCTRQLADVVVSFCAPNVSNLQGVMSIVHSFQRDDLREAREGRPIQCLMVPSRVDMNELEQRNRFRDEFTAISAPFLPEFCRASGQTFWNLRIPYVPFHAYRETLSVGVHHGIEELQHAYAILSAYLVLLTPAGSAVRSRCEAEVARVAPLESLASGGGSSAHIPAAASADWLQRVASRTLDAAPEDERRALLDAALQLVAYDERSGRLIERRLTEDDLAERRSAIETFLRAGVVELGGGEPGTRTVRFAERFDVERWEPVQTWIAEPANRTALAWRDRLAPLAREWDRGGRQLHALLRGTMLQEAMRARDVLAQQCTAVEREYLDACIAADARSERKRRWTRRVAVAGAAVAAAGAIAWTLYTRTDAYQIYRLQVAGSALVGSAPPKTVREWSRALVMAGEYDAVEGIANALRDPAGRAAVLAETARAVAVVGAAQRADDYAAKALAVARATGGSASLLMQIALEFEDIPSLRPKAIEAAKDVVARLGKDPADALTRLDRARALRIAGQVDEAARLLDESATAVLKQEDPGGRLRGLAEIARLRLHVGGAMTRREEIWSIPHQLSKDPLALADAWATVSEVMRAAGDLAAADDAARESFKTLRAILPQQAQNELPLYVAGAARRLVTTGPAVEQARWAIGEVRSMSIADTTTADGEPSKAQLAARERLQRIRTETVGQAAEVLAAHDRMDEALDAVALIGLPEDRVVYLAGLADQMSTRGTPEPAIKAALRARDDAQAVKGARRGLSILRAAEALARVHHAAEVHTLLALLEPAPPTGVVPGAFSAPALDPALTARVVKVWARIGEFDRARRLLETLPSGDRLSGSSTLLFEYWRRRDPGRAESLEEMKSSA